MNGSRRFGLGCVALLLVAGAWAGWAVIAEAAESAAVATVAAPSIAPATPAGRPRVLAPGVMRDVSPMRRLQETVSRHDMIELLAADPKMDWAKDVAIRHDVFALNFSFKPMRFVWVDLPQESGRMQRKLIRYLVYNVTNPGKVAHPMEQPDGTFKVEPIDRPVRFVPRFTLESQEPGDNRVYPDRVIPLAVPVIQMREDPNRQFLTSVEICREIQPNETLWGVATWEDVDPVIDRFSIYVSGLTNAYRWTEDPAQYKPGAPADTYRRIERKTLKLNFWRPGDEYFESEREIRFGMPGQVDYEWVYR